MFNDMISSFPAAIPTPIKAALLSAGIAIVRVVYDRQETKWHRVVLEAAFCGGITFVGYYAVKAAGVDETWSVVIGGAIGSLGSETVRSLANRIINRKIDQKEDV
jgi:lambda family phage holin